MVVRSRNCSDEKAPGDQRGQGDADEIHDAGAHALGKFIRDDLNGKVERVELLPYHALGQHKWTDMGEKYELEGIEPPTKESMVHIKEIIRSYGANVL